jgi:hypothetical protein
VCAARKGRWPETFPRRRKADRVTAAGKRPARDVFDIFRAEVGAQGKRSFTSTVHCLKCRQVPSLGPSSVCPSPVCPSPVCPSPVCPSPVGLGMGREQALGFESGAEVPLLDASGSASSSQCRDIPLIGLGFPTLDSEGDSRMGSPALLTGGQSRVHHCSSSWRTWMERAGSVWWR